MFEKVLSLFLSKCCKNGLHPCKKPKTCLSYTHLCTHLHRGRAEGQSADPPVLRYTCAIPLPAYVIHRLSQPQLLICIQKCLLSREDSQQDKDRTGMCWYTRTSGSPTQTAESSTGMGSCCAPQGHSPAEESSWSQLPGGGMARCKGKEV